MSVVKSTLDDAAKNVTGNRAMVGLIVYNNKWRTKVIHVHQCTQ